MQIIVENCINQTLMNVCCLIYVAFEPSHKLIIKVGYITEWLIG